MKDPINVLQAQDIITYGIAETALPITPVPVQMASTDG